MNKRSLINYAFVSLAIILSLSVSANAQLTRGTISGTVTDMTAAAILGVQVTIQNLDTGIERGAVTNEFGVYRFPALEPGRYSVEFKLEGFQDRKVASIDVSTAEEIVVNQSLSVEVVATEVTVVTAPSGVEVSKADPTIASTLEQRVIQDLPITALARDATRLALLAPTVSRAPGSNEFSANGQRARNNNFMIDGTDNNDIVITVDVARILPEAVSEVKIQTTPYSAEFGRSSGAQIQAITRNGSNEFHGEAWDYYRGNWMQPVTLTNKRAGIRETPGFVQHQFGGLLAGPIIKNRTFFYGLLDLNVRRESPDARNATPTNIPTPAGYAALQNVPLGPGQSAESRQAMLQALSFLPEVHRQVGSYDNLTTRTVNGVAIQTGTIRIPIANPRDYWYNVGRIDHQLTSKDNISYRYLLDHRNQPDITSNTQFGTKWTAARLTFNQNHAISYTRVFTPHFMNEFRTAYIRANFDSPERDPKSATVMITQLFTAGGLRGFPQARISNTYQWQDVGTYFLGRHSLKFGVDLRYNKLFNRSGTDAKGTWTFDNLQEFLNNRAFSLVQAVNEASFDARETNEYYFFQDDIKATQNLTFNLGIRYEYSTVPLGFFGAANDTIAAAGVPRPARPDKNNWAPRFGFAYSPANPVGIFGKLLGQGQSSIRGGFGVAYDVLFLNILTNNASNYPRVLSSTTNQPATINLFPTLASKVAVLPPFDPLATFGNATTDIQNPTTHFWSLAFQRQFHENYVLELAYTGNRSYHQLRQGQLNPATLTPQQAATVIQTQNANSIPGLQARRLNPAWGPRITVESTAKGEYHAGYAKFDKRISNGLLFGASYTFSANFSDSDEPYGGNNVVISSPQVPQDYFNLRNEWSRSIFDKPHRFVLHYVYEIPWFSGSAANHPVLQQIFKGWQMSGSTELESGLPFTIRTGVDSAGIGTNASARPNSNPAGILIKDPVTNDLRTFSIPLNGTGIVTLPAGFLANTMPGGGNLGRNTFRGPGFQNWNFSLMKTFTLWEQVKFQFRTDFINLWNHNNFTNPDSVLNSASFGSNTANPITDSREMLFVGRIKF